MKLIVDCKNPFKNVEESEFFCKLTDGIFFPLILLGLEGRQILWEVRRSGDRFSRFVPKTSANAHANPDKIATHNTRRIILAKVNAENYARSNSIGTRLLAEPYAAEATTQEAILSRGPSSGSTARCTTARTATVGAT